MSTLSTLKDAIKTQLNTLVTATTLAAAEEVDIRKDPLAGDIALFPHAYLMPPSMESVLVDNRTALRTYTFAIMVVEKAENVSSNTQIETLIENICNQFDNNPTLGSVANGAVEPSHSSPEPLQHNNRNFIVFFVTLKASVTFTATF